MATEPVVAFPAFRLEGALADWQAHLDAIERLGSRVVL